MLLRKQERLRLNSAWLEGSVCRAAAVSAERARSFFLSSRSSEADTRLLALFFSRLALRIMYNTPLDEANHPAGGFVVLGLALRKATRHLLL